MGNEFIAPIGLMVAWVVSGSNGSLGTEQTSLRNSRFCVADFVTLSGERRLHSKLYDQNF